MNKLELDLEENMQNLNSQIEELERLKNIIVESSQFKIQDGKTQMIDKKDEIEIRSRQQHVFMVTNISLRVIDGIYNKLYSGATKLEVVAKNQKRDELIIQIIALSHDLGHTPFGHSGEEVLNEFVKDIKDEETIEAIIEKRRKYFGEEYEGEQGHIGNKLNTLSFEHNEQSALEFIELVQKNNINEELVEADRIVKGILSHSISRVSKVPEDLLAQIVRQADKIDYRNFDGKEYDGYIDWDKTRDKELKNYINLPVQEKINYVVDNMIDEAIEKGKIIDDAESMQITKDYRHIYEDIIYIVEDDGNKELIAGNNRERNQVIYRKLLDYYYNNPDKIPTKALRRVVPIDENRKVERVKAYDTTKTGIEPKTHLERVIQYVNTFTNDTCEKAYRRLVIQRIIKGTGYGIEPVVPEDIEKRKQIQLNIAKERIRAREMYKASKTHTDEEILEMLKYKRHKFIEDMLTPKALEKIKENKEKKEQQNNVDFTLDKMMRDIDSIRTQDKSKEEIKSEIEKYLKRVEENKIVGIEQIEKEFYKNKDDDENEK